LGTCSTAAGGHWRAVCPHCRMLGETDSLLCTSVVEGVPFISFTCAQSRVEREARRNVASEFGLAYHWRSCLMESAGENLASCVIGRTHEISHLLKTALRKTAHVRGNKEALHHQVTYTLNTKHKQPTNTLSILCM
jgi:hypothetical protein